MKKIEGINNKEAITMVPEDKNKGVKKLLVIVVIAVLAFVATANYNAAVHEANRANYAEAQVAELSNMSRWDHIKAAFGTNK